LDNGLEHQTKSGFGLDNGLDNPDQVWIMEWISVCLSKGNTGGITFFNENLFFFACFDETIGTLVDNDEGGHGNNEPMAKGSENDEAPY
jgi:hypothetical protein